MKQWFKKLRNLKDSVFATLRGAWLRFKGWALAILIAIGVVSMPPVLAVDTTYTYTPATEYEDGTPLPIEEIAETRLYCSLGGFLSPTLAASEAGADGSLVANHVPGIWHCAATHIATNSIESPYSNVVIKQVLPTVGPKAPVLNP